jgi:hypothetical protein
MKKIIFTVLSFLIALCTVSAQKGINFNNYIAGGGRLHMFVDSGAKNIYYARMFPNQPNTSFSYLPEVDSTAIRVNFREKDSVRNYRYTILVDNKPLVVNKSFHKAELKDFIWKNDDFKDELLQFKTIGPFPIKEKTITILVYSVEKPLNIEKYVFYGKPIPKAEVKLIAKRFAIDKGVDYSRIIYPKDRENITLTQKDDELTLVKDRSDLDYLYGISIKDKQTNKIVFESDSWQYGGYVDESGLLSPYVKMNTDIFKKSGDYEVIIQPSIDWDNCLDCNFSDKEVEKYTTRHTLAITLDQESYSEKELWTYTLIVTLFIGLAFLVILYFIKKRNKNKLAEEEQQKNMAKLQLTSIRSQLNPHFLFNALAGIQNLMNKSEIDNANKYLSKFARLTRNVLDDKELISLSQEKTLLDDYLQMEQLRFGFKYEINLSEDLANIEIPSMLLQPFVENAVKHGISQKATAGKIVIEFFKQANDLVLRVTDNGNGFDTKKKNNGLGLMLTDRRIALLNSVYKDNHLTLDIQSSSNGTIISLTLTDWL